MASPRAPLSPTLSALMCDGMGWFDGLHFKRMLLVFDRIYYLLPGDPTSFLDPSGEELFPLAPPWLARDPTFEILRVSPRGPGREAMHAAARLDASRPSFRARVEAIPRDEQRYTWRVVNGDASLGDDASPRLAPDDLTLAHALLLARFLQVAEDRGAVPITGKGYIHGLIAEKVAAVERAAPAHRQRAAKTAPVVEALVSSFVPDEVLARTRNQDILAFKERHRELFARFSLTLRQTVDQIGALPAEDGFAEELRDVLRTQVWAEAESVRQELRGNWETFSRSAIKAGIGAALSLAIAPLSLGQLSVSALLIGAGGALPWLSSEVLDFVERRQRVRQNGLYYLMEFAG